MINGDVCVFVCVHVYVFMLDPIDSGWVNSAVSVIIINAEFKVPESFYAHG